MTAAVVAVVAIAVAGPDLVTIAETMRWRGRRRRGPSVWPLLSVAAAAHAALGVAAVLAGQQVPGP